MAAQLAAAFLPILALHPGGFPAGVTAAGTGPAGPDRAAISAHYEKHALAGIGLFKRAERAATKQQVTTWTEAEMNRQWQGPKVSKRSGSRSSIGSGN
ncbi:MAG TPA: hypothetical protein VI011_22340 [Asanoa sp.]